MNNKKRLRIERFITRTLHQVSSQDLMNAEMAIARKENSPVSDKFKKAFAIVRSTHKLKG